MRVTKFYYLINLLFCYVYIFFVWIPFVNTASLILPAAKSLDNNLYYNTLPFEDCGSHYDILYLSISSCSTLPCEMQRGSKVIVNVIFDDGEANTSFLKHRVRWIFNAIRTDAVISPDPCVGNQLCITNDHWSKSYWATVSVNNKLPVLYGSMRWEAEDKYQNEVLCFKVPVVIVT